MPNQTQPTDRSVPPQGGAGPVDCVFSIEHRVWKARLNGRVLPTTWNSKGAAEAYLDLERRRADSKSQTDRLSPLAAAEILDFIMTQVVDEGSAVIELGTEHSLALREASRHLRRHPL